MCIASFGFVSCCHTRQRARSTRALNVPLRLAKGSINLAGQDRDVKAGFIGLASVGLHGGLHDGDVRIRQVAGEAGLNGRQRRRRRTARLLSLRLAKFLSNIVPPAVASPLTARACSRRNVLAADSAPSTSKSPAHPELRAWLVLNKRSMVIRMFASARIRSDRNEVTALTARASKRSTAFWQPARPVRPKSAAPRKKRNGNTTGSTDGHANLLIIEIITNSTEGDAGV